MTLETKSAWYCIKTQTKREHIAAGYLRELEGVDVFCPRLRYRKATRRGKIWWVEPLFPGYLLAKFDLSKMERAVTFCQGVRGLVRFGAQVPAIPDQFVESLMSDLLNREAVSGEVVTIGPMVETGDEVEIASGPLEGMKGTVVSVAPAVERIKVLLEFLGKEHAVDLDLFAIITPKRSRSWDDVSPSP